MHDYDPGEDSYSYEPTEHEEDYDPESGMYGWSAFWRWARANGYPDRAAVNAALGGPEPWLTPGATRFYLVERRAQESARLERLRAVTASVLAAMPAQRVTTPPRPLAYPMPSCTSPPPRPMRQPQPQDSRSRLSDSNSVVIWLIVVVLLGVWLSGEGNGNDNRRSATSVGATPTVSSIQYVAPSSPLSNGLSGDSGGYHSGCGTRGGPGYRLANGKCASWRDYYSTGPDSSRYYGGYDDYYDYYDKPHCWTPRDCE